MSLKTLCGALCDCFVPRSNVGEGGVLGNVYGRPATALCAPDFANAVSITRTAQDQSYVPTKNGWISVYAESPNTNQSIAGTRCNGFWTGLINTVSYAANKSVFTFVEKGTNVTIVSLGTIETKIYFIPVKGA